MRFATSVLERLWAGFAIAGRYSRQAMLDCGHALTINAHVPHDDEVESRVSGKVIPFPSVRPENG